MFIIYLKTNKDNPTIRFPLVYQPVALMLICIACLLAVVMVFLMHQNPNKGVQCIVFSENLKTLRKQKGFSQEELASRLHVVRQTISKWEKNLSVPDADTLIRLAEILEVSVSELLGSKIETENENGNVTNDVAKQLSRINEQLAIKNRRSRRIWKTIVIILATIFLLSVFIIIFLSVPDLNNSTHNNQPIVNVETIMVDE